MKKRALRAIAPREASAEEMQRFCLSDDRCFFVHAKKYSKDLLALSVYHSELAKQGQTKPLLIVYCGKEDFINRLWIADEQRYAWRFSCLDKYYPYNASKSLLDTASQKAISTYFSSEEPALEAIEAFQQRVLMARLAAKHREEKKRIDNAMALVPPLPRRFEDFIATIAMPDRYFFYDYAARKMVKGFCTNCRNEVAIEKPRHNQTCRCPGCGAPLMCKSRGKHKYGIHDGRNVCLPQKVKGGFVLRYFKASRIEHLDGRREVDYHEYCRHMFTGHAMTAYCYESFKQTGEVRWCYDHKGLHPYDDCLYPSHLDKLIVGTVWQYSVPKLYLNGNTRPCLSWYFAKYLAYPYVENLLKNGLNRLADNIIDGSGLVKMDVRKTRIHELMMVSKRGVSVLRALEADGTDLKMVRTLEKHQLWDYDASMLRLMRDRIGYHVEAYIKHILPYTTNKKALRYVEKLDSFALGDWIDYAKMAAELGYDLRKPHALFPHNLKKAHDTATWLHREKKAEISEEEFASHVQRLKEFEWDGGKSPYQITAPQCAVDIVHEGHQLNHCVHSYIESVIEGKCEIMFLRRKEAPSTSFVTLEIRDNLVRQARGFNNESPKENISMVIEDYEKRLAIHTSISAAA